MSQCGGDVTNEEKFILSVDVGTSTIRSHIYDSKCQIVGSAKENNTLITPLPGHVELDPNQLWNKFVIVIKNSVTDAGIPFESISSLGISTMRGTFITWNCDTGNPYHNFITWQDTRSAEICNDWNEGIQLRLLRGFGSVLYFLSRRKRFLAASIFKMSTPMVLPRLINELNTNEQLRADIITCKARFGTVDTWLVWKLTSGKIHATDPSNICTSGFYDPFRMKYGTWALHMFSIPSNILPEIRDTNGGFGSIDESIFGYKIDISCCIGDQQAAVFGECCFNPGDIKITLGTGSFVNVNTGSIPFASCQGLYPVVGWKLQIPTKNCDQSIKEGNVTYLVEGGSHDTGTAINWMQKIGLISTPEESCVEAMTVTDSNGVHFIPGFNGLQAPYNDPSASGGFIGITSTTTKGHMIRSVLQSIAFRIRQLFIIVKEEVDVKLSNTISINGGVASNDFVCKSIVDTLGTILVRDRHREMSSRGVAFICGITKGIWTMEQLKDFKEKERIFEPNEKSNIDKTDSEFKSWTRAVSRFTEWKQ